MNGLSYKKAGVDIDLGASTKSRIRELAAATHSENVLEGIGLFSGFYRLEQGEYREPVIVSSIDGVGTKVRIAQMMGVYDTIGADLVNHCVNDIIVCGAEPAFFLDYIAADTLDPDMVAGIVRGIAHACRKAGCALIGGETAEMPGIYARNSFDVAGAIVGIVEKSAIINGRSIQAGDVVVGLAASGLHTNGYSLARKVFFEEKGYAVDKRLPDMEATLGEELLHVHRSYLHAVRQVRSNSAVRGIAHITGGGIVGNTTRLLRKGLTLKIDWSAWQWPPIFEHIRREGDVAIEEMRKVFNLGIGLTLIVAPSGVDVITRICTEAGEGAHIIGEIVLQS